MVDEENLHYIRRSGLNGEATVIAVIEAVHPRRGSSSQHK